MSPDKTSAELFTATCTALFGPEFVAPVAAALNVDKNTVGKWRDGKSRLPPGVWTELTGMLRDRESQLPTLVAAAQVASGNSSLPLPDGIPEQVLQHMKTFHPYTLKRMSDVHVKKTRFAHYTSAEAALEIIRTGKIWMRPVSCMNDSSEVSHGLDCLSAAYRGDHGKRLKAFVDAKFPGLSAEVEKDFDSWQHALRYHTFVGCMSEHAGPGLEDEDQHGRLSMWRAYGRTAKGVALVVNQAPFWMTSTALGLFTSPVAYLSDQDYQEELGVLASSLEANDSYVDTLGRDGVKWALVAAFSAAAISTKHPGFREEREWRVIRTPNYPFRCPFNRSLKSVNGVPQEILEVELKDDPANGVVGLALPAFLDRVIIGPTEYSIPTFYGLKTALEQAGVENAGDKIKFSHVPLRVSAGY